MVGYTRRLQTYIKVSIKFFTLDQIYKVSDLFYCIVFSIRFIFALLFRHDFYPFQYMLRLPIRNQKV